MYPFNKQKDLICFKFFLSSFLFMPPFSTSSEGGAKKWAWEARKQESTEVQLKKSEAPHLLITSIINRQEMM